VVEALAADAETSAIPIIVLTAATLSAADRQRIEKRVLSLARKGDFTRESLLLAVERATGPAHPEPRDGGPTVLVVDDHDLNRELVRTMLERKGYRVVTAESPAHALELARSHDGPIDLLLTDVVMPGMSGRDLADLLVAERPELRVLYASGYTRDAISSQGVLDERTAFLEKPFTSASLARAVRDVLDS
jgi:CheY-like chemotaxis protein